MKLCWILFSAAILLIGIYVPCEAFDRARFQDFVDKYVDVEKFKEEGFKSLNATAIKYIWNFFKTKFIRDYSSTEEEKERLQIFRAHLKRVLESNIIKKPTFQLGLNEYADWTVEEFKTLKTGLVRSNIHPFFNESDLQAYQASARRRLSEVGQDHSHFRRSKRNLHTRRNKDRRVFSDQFEDFFNKHEDKNNNDNNGEQSTDGFDWRTKGVVSSVKNQLQCGSCYAFATTAALESVYAIKTKSQNVISFSPQQIVDCSSDGNGGCNGGDFTPTINYLSGQGGKIATTDSYPYVGTAQTCKTDGINEVDLGNIEYGSTKAGNEKELAKALVKYGPMYIALNADSDLLMFYQAGVLKIDHCPNRPRNLNHALALVGYGYDNDLQKAYWIIKNSWGTRWGENGYLRLAKDSGNMCGVATEASYAILT